MITALLVATLSASPVAPAQPEPADLIYYHARLALQDQQPEQVLKLWLLRNSLLSNQGLRSRHDVDFLSTLWVALGDLGYCSDGLPLDRDGAGLWPVALHNWFLKNMRRGAPPDRAAPFDAFDVPVQQRFVELSDVLSVQELDTVRFFRTGCYRMKDVLAAAGQSSSADSRDRKVQLMVLTALIEAAQASLAADVRGQSTLQARLLDIRLKEVDLLDRRTRRARRRTRLQLKALGGKVAPQPEVARSKSMLKLLAPAASWTAEDWLALDPDRRMYLYRWVQRAGLDNAQTHLQVLDELMQRRAGVQVTDWLGFTSTRSVDRAQVWSGDRGQRLLGMERNTGFRERAVISLHRGVYAVGAGDLGGALRAFAYALHFVQESTAAEAVRRLSLRWLSFVTSQFVVSDELVTLLVTLVPRGDLGRLLEDLMWSAALSADKPSFERTVGAQRGRGALRQRSARLVPLAAGDVGRFVTLLERDFEDSPHVVLRFVRQFLERLESEGGLVRSNHRGTLLSLRDVLSEQGARLQGSLSRRADKLQAHCDALLEGLPEATVGDTARDRARALSATKQVFAGSIRMAPSDALPWPFEAPDVRAPSVLQPIPITPVEWKDDARWVMGWKLGQ